MALIHQKSAIVSANIHFKATNTNRRVLCLVCTIWSSAQRILLQSPIFNIFNSQQAVFQKLRFSAKNGNNLKAAC
jgi:hypothetical protein